ncbi:MAG: ribonuclease HI [SAR324 cluster bacterium]|nr:ribonuclease HI [SAR324 cluster bacterium]MBL7035494.1 ribonuclease HI [SAR324 cluster bacterium]
MSKNTVIIYTDGACSPNPGIGGWGAVLISKEHELRTELSGSEVDSTNNRMELTAAINALRALKKPCQVRLFTDSSYLKNAFELKWLNNWKTKNWKTKGGKPVANKDLWLLLLEVSNKHQVSWHWVKGHSGDPENDRCDELAVNARLELAASIKTKAS